MIKFKVGDIVTGNEASDVKYIATTSEMTRGKVLSVIDDTRMKVEVIEHKKEEFIGRTHIVQMSYFKYPQKIEFKETSEGTFITIDNKYTVFTKAKKKDIAVVNVSDIEPNFETASFIAIAKAK